MKPNNTEPRKLDKVQRGGVVFRRKRMITFLYAGHKSANAKRKPWEKRPVAAKRYIGTVNNIWITTKGERCINVQLMDGDYKTFYVYGVHGVQQIAVVDAA